MVPHMLPQRTKRGIGMNTTLPDHVGVCLACGQAAALDDDRVCINCYMKGGEGK